MNQLHLGDCLEVLKTLPENSVDSIVTDPPYGLSAAPNSGKKSTGGFMGKKWDYDVPSVEIWKECLRVLKPGGYLLAFAGTRTQHRMAVRIEDAGFEIRDMLAWVFGSGFPKSLDVSKAIDKAAGANREVVGTKNLHGYKSKEDGNSRGSGLREDFDKVNQLTAPATPEAKKWEGWGTALKPALEPITLARKPLSEKTVAENVLKWGTGGINIDACRIPVNKDVDDPRLGGKGTWSSEKMAKNVYEGGYAGERVSSSELGRFPANLIHDGSDEVLSAFPDAKGQQGDLKNHKREIISPNGIYGKQPPRKDAIARIETDKSAARFFYCPKTTKKDRGEGNNHPTVKPTELMLYLIKLVTKPEGITLDPFMGSGSTGKAAARGNFKFIGIEREQDFYNIAQARINHEAKKPKQQTFEF